MCWYERLEIKWNRGSKRQQAWVYIGLYTIIFIICFLIAYSPFIFSKKTLIWEVDGRTQFYPYMVYIGRYLRQILIGVTRGELSIPLFDLNISSGDDVLGFLNGQWQTDPLLIISAFVPVKYSEYLYGFLAVFRLYLSGLSFSLLCLYFGKEKLHSLIGSVIYCFSGYAVFCSTEYPSFVNPMIILPLLIIGTDEILKKKCSYILIFSVCYAALCGYYHLYMMTIMISAYVLVRFFNIYKSNYIKNFVIVVQKGLLGYCLGIGLSAIIFFPGIAEFLNAGRFAFSNYQGFYTWYQYRTRLLRLIAPPGSMNDMAFAAIVLFALAIMFSSKKRYALKILTAIAFTFYLTTTGGLIMNGFQYSSTRWTFGLVLVVSFVVVDMLPELLELSEKKKLICLVVLYVYVFISLLSTAARKVEYVLVGVVFLSLTALITMMQIRGIGLLKQYDGKKSFIIHQQKMTRTFLCLVLVIINVGVNSIYRFASDQGNYISIFSNLGYEVDHLEKTMEREMEPYLLNNPVGRADSSSFVVNAAMVWRIPGMLCYSAVANKDLLEFWDKTESAGNLMYFSLASSDQRTITNALLSTKYHVESEENSAYVPYGYIPIMKTEKGDLIFNNKYALPWGYTYDTVISYDDLDQLNGIKKQETMLQAIALEKIESNTLINTIQFDEYVLPYKIEYENCKWEDGNLSVYSNDAKITLNFIVPAEVEGYVRLDGFDINESGLTEFSIRMDCGDVSKKARIASKHFVYYYGRENYLFNLGYSEEKRTSLTITFPSKGIFKLNDIELYALPMDNFPAHIESLRAEPLENIEWSTNRLTGTVDISKDKILCVSVPYSKGWSAKVDGEKVEILCGNYMFMAVPLTEGFHDIEFNYCSPGLKFGVAITIISVFVVVCMIYKERRK